MIKYRTLAERISASFLAWEIRGRGWQLADYPCELEPPFRPFFLLPGDIADDVVIDDGKRHTLISAVGSLIASPFKKSNRSSTTEAFEFSELPPYQAYLDDGPLVTLSIRTPADFKSVEPNTKQLLLALGASIALCSVQRI